MAINVQIGGNTILVKITQGMNGIPGYTDPGDSLLLSAIAAISGSGFLSIDSVTSAAILRALTGTANEITVANGTGVSGVPTISLPTALTFTGKTITGGTYLSTTLTSPVVNTPTITAPIIRNWDGWEDANETWTYFSVDGPIGVVTVPTDATLKYSVGMKVKWTQTTVKYGIIVALTATTLTIYTGTDYTLANAAITLNFYTFGRAPMGFPMNPDKWTVVVANTNTNSQSNPTISTWYNIGSLTISIPIGVWEVSYQCATFCSRSPSGIATAVVTLSTTNNSESDAQMTGVIYGASSTDVMATINRSKVITLAAKTSYFLIGSVTQTGHTLLNFFGSAPWGTIVIKARCVYL